MRGKKILKDEIVDHKEAELKNLGNFQAIHTAKYKNTKSVARWTFEKEISVDQSYQQKPGCISLHSGRMTLKAIQRSSALPLPLKTQSA